MKVTVKDIAVRAGVSISTVSRVINDNYYVDPNLKKRVLDAIRDLDYHPNILARSMITRKSLVIGVVISDNANPLFSLIVRGIEDVLMRRGYNIILCNTSQDVGREKAQIRVLKERQVDGYIISVANEQADYLDDALLGGTPAVFVNRSPKKASGDIILTDNARGSKEAIDHLFSLGHTKIGIVGCSEDYITGRERLAGYLASFQEKGVSIDENLIVKATIRRKEQGVQATRELFERAKPTALLGATYYSTLGMLKAVAQLGLRIPGDVSVVGFDDPDWSDCFNPPLTTVAQPAEDIGKIAATRLLDRIEERLSEPYKVLRLSPTLMIRQSCSARP